MIRRPPSSTLFPFFFFNDTATTEIYTLSLHDALPIWPTMRSAGSRGRPTVGPGSGPPSKPAASRSARDRKSTRLNSSHANISYAVFCLKKKLQSRQYLVCRLLLEKKKMNTNDY